MKTVLITGGSGLVGTHFINSFNKKYNFKILTSNKNLSGKENYYFWNYKTGEIDVEAVKNVDVIINLAGANIAAKRWTNARKIEILESRVKSTELLYQTIKQNNIPIAEVISASAVGFYDNKDFYTDFSEEDQPGNGFLSEVTKKWEEAADKFTNLNIRVVKLRIGAVLAKNGGVVKKLQPIFKLGLGSALGSGKQSFPVIHIDDLINIIDFSIENDFVNGAINSVLDENLTNQEFSRVFAKVLKRPFILPPVPKFVLKLILGELSEMLINGCKVNNQKIKKLGLNFKFNKVEEALKNIIDT